MFTVMFAVPRSCGWVAQWLEMLTDPEQKLSRPRQIYLGPEERRYGAMDSR
jgi:citrate synthase